MINANTCGGVISFTLGKGLSNGVSRGDFLLELHYKPLGWHELHFAVLPSELHKQQIDFMLERLYIVEDPVEAVCVWTSVHILPFCSYNVACKVSDVERV